jgi:hypothetical protein
MKRFLLGCVLFWACGVAPSAYAVTVDMPQFRHEVILADQPGVEHIVHAAIVAAAHKRRWVVIKDGIGKLRLQLLVRNRYSVVVDVRILGNSVAVDYVSSFNMRYRKGDSVEQIHPSYARWVRSLLQAARNSSVKSL